MTTSYLVFNESQNICQSFENDLYLFELHSVLVFWFQEASRLQNKSFEVDLVPKEKV